MSKRFSIFARVLAIILCMAMVLAGCNSTAGNNSNDGGNKGENKPVTPESQMSQSANNTIGAILGTDSPVNVLADAMNKGKITITADGVLENVLYIDSGKGYIADLLTVNVDGTEVDASVYFGDSSLALAIPMLLGDEVYGLNFDTLLSDLKSSAIWNLMGMSYEDFQSQTNMDLDAMMDVLTEALDAVGELESVVENASKDIKVESTNGKATVNGTEVDAVIVTTTLHSDDILAVMNATIDWMETTANTMVADLSEAMGGMDLESELGLDGAISDMRDELDMVFGDADLTFVVTSNIHPETQYMMSCGLDMTGTVDGTAGEMHVLLDFGVDPATSEKYTLTASVGAAGEDPNTVEIVLDRELGESTDVYTLTASMTEYGETYDMFEGSLTYSKDSHVFDLELNVDGEAMKVSGKYACDKDSLELGITSVEMDDSVTELNVTVLIEAVNDVPDMPKYTNVLKLSETELTDLITSISELLGGVEKDYAEPEYDYDYGYDYDDDYSENVDGY